MIDTKENVLCAVADLFLKYGVRSVSMDDIAHHQGISKKTIYQYFEDKNDLVNQVSTMLLEARMTEYSANSDRASNAIEELYTMSKLLRKHFSEINPSLMYDVQKYHPRAWELFLKHENDVVYHSVMDNLERGIKEGYFRAEINARVLARIRVEQIHISFDERLFPKDQFDFTDVQVQLFDHYVHGLLTESGLELYKNYQKQNNE
jgi:AcrR family transcriptional regulator